jgi:hypothetical protein
VAEERRGEGRQEDCFFLYRFGTEREGGREEEEVVVREQRQREKKAGTGRERNREREKKKKSVAATDESGDGIEIPKTKKAAVCCIPFFSRRRASAFPARIVPLPISAVEDECVGGFHEEILIEAPKCTKSSEEGK